MILLKILKEKNRLIDVHEIGINKRINKFLKNYFEDCGVELKVAEQFFSLDHYGLARELSLPPNGDEFQK